MGDQPCFLVDGNAEPFVKPEKKEKKITMLKHTNGDLDGGMTNVLYNRGDGPPPPVWRCHGEQSDIKVAPAPFLTDDNAVVNEVPVQKRAAAKITDPQGGVAAGGLQLEMP